MMCGLSFAGKSTFAALLAAELDAVVIGLDAINAERGLDGGQGIPLEEWGRSTTIAHARAADVLRSGRAVLVDDTGSPRFVRDGWRAVAADCGVPFAIVWVRIDAERQRARVEVNRSRRRRHDVTDEVMADHVAQFEDPLEEHPFIVDADETTNRALARRIAIRIRNGEVPDAVHDV
jgi:predicted kinase